MAEELSDGPPDASAPVVFPGDLVAEPAPRARRMVLSAAPYDLLLVQAEDLLPTLRRSEALWATLRGLGFDLGATVGRMAAHVTDGWAAWSALQQAHARVDG